MGQHELRNAKQIYLISVNPGAQTNTREMNEHGVI